MGRGGKRGKTAGRGTKGQKARAGRKIRPEIRDQIKKIPKLRGYSFKSIQGKPLAISISVIEKAFEEGAEINRQGLIDAKVVAIYKGQIPNVKIVGGKGEIMLSKKIKIFGIPVSASVKAAVLQAGGEVK